MKSQNGSTGKDRPAMEMNGHAKVVMPCASHLRAQVPASFSLPNWMADTRPSAASVCASASFFWTCEVFGNDDERPTDCREWGSQQQGQQPR